MTLQTQLTEEAVRKLRKESLRAIETWGPKEVPHHVMVAALADAYLAQQRVIEAARRVVEYEQEYSRHEEIVDEKFGAACPVCDEWLTRIEAAEAALRDALVSVGSPETPYERCEGMHIGGDSCVSERGHAGACTFGAGAEIKRVSVGSPETTRAESVTAPRPDEKRNPDEGSGGHRTGSAGVGSPETRGTDLVLLAANRITHMDYPDDAEERLRRFSEDAELLAATVLAETRETEQP